MAKRHDVLEFAVLGVLAESPLHGYELRKRLTTVLGPFRALSYGSLYPCLRRVQGKGLIDEVSVTPAVDSEAPPLSGRRARVVYALTADGKEAFAGWVDSEGPEAWEDEAFAARMAFFGRTDAAVRLRVLEGRRARLEERLAALQSAIDRTDERMDQYAQRLQRHGVEGAEREVSWLEELIATERGARQVRKAARVQKRVAKAATRSRKGSSHQ